MIESDASNQFGVTGSGSAFRILGISDEDLRLLKSAAYGHGAEQSSLCRAIGLAWESISKSQAALGDFSAIVEVAEKVCFGRPVKRFLEAGWNGAGLPPEMLDRVHEIADR